MIILVCEGWWWCHPYPHSHYTFNNPRRENWNPYKNLLKWNLGCFWSFKHVYGINLSLFMKLYNSIKMQVFKKGGSSSREKRHGCFLQQILRHNVRCFWSYHRKAIPGRGFISNPIVRPYAPLKNGTRNFYNNSTFKNYYLFM